MLDKMEPDRIFLLMVRRMESVSVYLIASSLYTGWGWGGCYLALARDPGTSSLSRATYLAPGTMTTQPLAKVSSQPPLVTMSC